MPSASLLFLAGTFPTQWDFFFLPLLGNVFPITGRGSEQVNPVVAEPGVRDKPFWGSRMVLPSQPTVPFLSPQALKLVLNLWFVALGGGVNDPFAGIS